MKLWIPFAAGAGALFVIASILGPDWDLPPVDTEQVGYRGTGMFVHRDREDQVALKAANVVPESPYTPDAGGDRARDVYENVQVLGDLSQDQFDHLMASITEWVAPEEGCNYCHNPENLASDEIYTKVVARRMIQMNHTINVAWKPHVAETGVTCYTCHRGKHIPENVWYRDVAPKPLGGFTAERAGQNIAAQFAGITSLPQNALERFLLEDNPIRVTSTKTFDDPQNSAGVKEAEQTYALMMHMSESLGGNCMTCHNSRAFNDWDQSPPQRVTAWHGIRMARELNATYMDGLAPVFPANRKGPEGDVLKIGCSTCHAGVQKPLYGESMLQDYIASLATRGGTGVPDYSTYKPGETQKLAPANTSALDMPAASQLASN
jgi:photosynthetic reaction center cytochrome c subunit